MIINKRKYLYNMVILSIFIILSILSSIFLFHIHYLFGAGDMQFHLKRIMELETSFKHGNLFPLFSFNQFHGSAVFTLYPYLNLLPLILLSLFIKSNITLIYVFFGLNVFLSLTTSYYSSLNLSKSRQTSIVFAITYSLSIPFLAYGFYNMDLGVLTSISVFSLVLFGFISLIKYNKWVMLSIGLTILIFSHVLSVIIICGSLLLFLVFNYSKIIDRKFWISLFKSLCLIILLTSFMWIPLLRFGMDNITNTYPPSPIPPTRISFMSLLKNGAFSYITYDLGIVALIGVILPWIPYSVFYKKFDHFTKQMYWISIIVVVVCSSPIWILADHGIFKVLRAFQFSWRFYIIPELLLCYVVAVCITKCIKRIHLKWLLIGCIIVLVVGCQFLGQNRLIHESINSPSFTKNYINRNTYTERTNVHHMMLSLRQFHFTYYKNPRYPYYKITNENQLHLLTNTYTDENTPDYYPVSALSKVNYIDNNDALYDHNKVVKVKHIGYNKFLFNSPNKINQLALPLLNYNGEHLQIYLNHNLIHYKVNKNNLITVNGIKIGKNTIRIKYVPSITLTIIKWLLFINGLFWLLYISWLRFCNIFNCNNNRLLSKLYAWWHNNWRIQHKLETCIFINVTLFSALLAVNYDKIIRFWITTIAFIFCSMIEYLLVIDHRKYFYELSHKRNEGIYYYEIHKHIFFENIYNRHLEVFGIIITIMCFINLEQTGCFLAMTIMCMFFIQRTDNEKMKLI